MKGLLSRLAAGAAGTTVTIRSDARLALGGPAPLHSVPDVQAPPLTFETRPDVPTAPTFQNARSEALHDRLTSIAGTAAGLPGRLDADPRSDVDAPNQSDRAVSDAAAVKLPFTAPPRLADYSVSQIDSRRSHSALEQTGRSADLRSDDAGRSRSTVRIVREPPLLVPLAAANRTFAPQPIAGTIASTPGRVVPHSALEEGDVHIHIGCVEVTAVHEAAAPRRRPVSAQQPPMSLDAYLAKRVRG